MVLRTCFFNCTGNDVIQHTTTPALMRSSIAARWAERTAPTDRPTQPIRFGSTSGRVSR